MPREHLVDGINETAIVDKVLRNTTEEHLQNGFSDLFSYLSGKGVWGTTFYKNPLAIGFFEAHVLAIIIGPFLFRMSREQDWNFAMAMALIIHLILGVSNIIWFDGFSIVNAEIMGTIATKIHFVFVSLYVVIWFKTYLLKPNEKA